MRTSRILVIFGTILLGACGGGSSNGNSNPQTSPNPSMTPTPTDSPTPTPKPSTSPNPTPTPTSTPAAVNLNTIFHVAADCTAGVECPAGMYYVNNSADLGTINTTLQAQEQISDQWTNNHYAILLSSQPGSYSLAQPFELGYYTQVLGAGSMPESVTLIPGVEVHNQGGFLKGAPSCLGGGSNQLCETLGGLNNFWRGVENFTMDFSGMSNVLIFAVSQAAPIRSINFQGGTNNVLLCDYNTPSWNCGYTSGGFLANSTVNNTLIPGSQQQWITRNSSLGTASPASQEIATWNSVFVGNQLSTLPQPPATYGFSFQQPTDNKWDNFPVTTVNTTPIIREKAYLTCKDSCGESLSLIDWKVAVPQLRNNVSGPDKTAPVYLDVESQFYIIAPQLGTTSSSGVTTLDTGAIYAINNALAAGKNLLITPGVYNLDGGAINVTNNDTVILGLGLPSLVCTNGNDPCMQISAQKGVQLSGVVFDAGYNLTPSLLSVGSSKTTNDNSADPITLHDVFFRVAETQLSSRESGLERQTTAAAIIYTNNVIGDNLWVWRADHDKASSRSMTNPESNLVNWSQDRAQYGLIVYGDNVTMYGLAVEHFQNYQTVWKGESGKVYFYQSEMPYDVPSLDMWSCTDPTTGISGGKGCASYVINATDHFATGVGVYTYFPFDAVMAPSAFLVTDSSANVTISHAVGKWLNGVNGSGYNNLIRNNNSQCWGYGVFYAPSPTDALEYSVLGLFNSSAATQTCQ